MITWNKKISCYNFRKISSVVRILAILVIFLLAQLPARALALSQDQINALGAQEYYFNTDDETGGVCSLSAASGVSGINAPAGTESPKWVSTLAAPYSLEDFVVELLRDIAVKEGVPETSTVTQQHVLALVAFADGEGGNINNTDIYNPFNSGYTAPDLLPAGAHSVSGVQSFASFDDGVEATARVMTGTGGSEGLQTRLGSILAQPNTTAQDFMYTLTYYQNYTNNAAWASASAPPNQDSYYQGRLQLIQSTEANYANIASLLLGPPGNSDPNNQHKPGVLRYSFAADTSTTATAAASSGCAGGGPVQGNLVQTAVNLAWDDVAHPQPPEDNATSHGFQELNVGDPATYTTASYQQAVQQYQQGVDSTSYTDCGVFVATVMRSSGIDPSYPASGTSTQLEYAKMHPEKYTVIDVAKSTADLQVGDILINSGHTYIYVGKQADGYSVAEASQGNHSPEIDSDPVFIDSLNNETFSIIRVIQ